jgi:signal transduction histidine kinase
VGQIALANKEGNYTEKDLAAITRLGEYYALAIQRKRAQDSLQKAHDALEVRVEERTAELRRLSSELLSIQEEERKRIALEVHDGIGQSLSAVKYRVEAALAELGEACSAKAFGSLKPIIPVVQEAVEETRRIQRNLRPPTLDDLGLLATLSWFCREFETTYEGVRVERKIELEEDAVPDMLKIVIYRVIQEAMNNIAKHSGASAVTLSLASIDGRIEMTVTDNGVGFDLERVPSPEMSERGMGLASMRERAELSGGLLSIKSEKGQGTVIHAAWPVDSVREAFRTK